MTKTSIKQGLYCLFIIIINMHSCTLMAQEGDDDNCFKAQTIMFPFSENDFSKSEILVEGRKLNALYYQYQDKYTFWYKFVATKDVEIKFSVSASKVDDRYGVTAYRYGENNFCKQLVNEGIDPLMLPKSTIFTPSRRLIYLYTLSAKAGETFYISVLSLNAEDCGHYLRLESGDERMSIHAIHRPCYNFAQLEIPDFDAARMQIDDVELFLEGLASKERITDAASPKQRERQPSELKEEVKDVQVASTQGFGGLTSIVIESADDDLISVGDRLVLNEVFFYTNTFAFKPVSESELQQLLAFMRDNPSVSIEIQGHTANNTEDIRPDPNFKNQGKDWNFKGSSLKLSEERAKAVREYLIANGIHKKRLIAVGYGDTMKRVPDARTFEEAEQNMRVEVVITGK